MVVQCFGKKNDESIQYSKIGLRDNVVQLLVFELRLLLLKAHALSEKWGGAPVLLAGDFNSTPDLNISTYDRRYISGQERHHHKSFVMARPINYYWTDEELKNATGSSGCTVLGHPLKLHSSYSSIKGNSLARDRHGEPLATTYHSKFVGTVDYIWYSSGLSCTGVLNTLPVYTLKRIGGLPNKYFGSDHLAMVSNLPSQKKVTVNIAHHMVLKKSKSKDRRSRQLNNPSL